MWRETFLEFPTGTDYAHVDAFCSSQNVCHLRGAQIKRLELPPDGMLQSVILH